MGKLMDRAEREQRGTETIFVFGVPELLERRERQRWDRRGKEELMESMKRAKKIRYWHLFTAFVRVGVRVAHVHASSSSCHWFNSR